jgi:hypothetical protein
LIGGKYLEKRVEWERKVGYRSAIPISKFPVEGYSIVGKEKRLSLENFRIYSGGLPGANWPKRNIHTDREVSIRSGIGRPVASGMMFEGFLVDLLLNFCGDSFQYGGQMSTIAINMAGDGDIVIPKMVIKEKKTAVGTIKGKTVYDIWCENQYNNKVMIGSAIEEL